jgi:hypothetical protein
MTQVEFIGALRTELRRRGVQVALPAARDFAEEVWPLVPEYPDMAVWADVFQETTRRRAEG